ncbi:MAG: phage scaffolding protein [Faecalibacterium sp.]
MKREDVSKQIPGLTAEQLDWLMAEHDKGIHAEKQRADALQTDLDKANAQLKTAQDGLAAFRGVDVDDLKNQITTLQGKLTAQAEGFAFDSALDEAIRAAKGRSIKAVRSMLDVESLKASKNRDADIKAALESCVKANAWAFGDAAATYSTGAEHGNDPHGDAADPVEAAFKALNPNIKL